MKLGVSQGPSRQPPAWKPAHRIVLTDDSSVGDEFAAARLRHARRSGRPVPRSLVGVRVVNLDQSRGDAVEIAQWRAQANG